MRKTFLFLLMLISFQSFAQCWQSMSAGKYHSMAIKNDGTLWAWGRNNFGQFGNNTTNSSNIPKQIGTSNDWVQISAGSSLSLGLKSDGTIWSMGFNNNGQLGIGSTVTYVKVPTQIGTDTNWKSINVGTTACSAIKTDGTLWTWGTNDYGQLGDGTSVSKNVPTKIGTATNWVSISAGISHMIGLKTNGTIWAWGSNASGNLGDGSSALQYEPVQIGTAANWKTISAGQGHSLGIKTDGTLWAWGDNSDGELGLGDKISKNVPTRVGTDTDWLSISGGTSFSYAIKTDHSIWNWGRNMYGELANGTSGDPDTVIPKRVGLTSNSSEVSAAYMYILQKSTTGDLSSSGYNLFGELGDGTTVNKNTFTPIVCGVLGIEEFDAAHGLNVYPNPVKDILNLSSEKKMTSVSIYNVSGQHLLTRAVDDDKAALDVSAFPSGTFLVTVHTAGDAVKTVKVIKR